MTGGMNGTLRKALTTLCLPKAQISYSSGLSDFLQEADEDPNNSSNMVYFYTRQSVKKQSSGEWNREHVWPQSLSGGLYGKRNWRMSAGPGMCSAGKDSSPGLRRWRWWAIPMRESPQS